MTAAGAWRIQWVAWPVVLPVVVACKLVPSVCVWPIHAVQPASSCLYRRLVLAHSRAAVEITRLAAEFNALL